MSLILNGKRKVSKKLAEQISERLLFDPQERADVLEPFRKRKLADQVAATESYVQLSADQYRVISDWRAFAILNLIKTEGFQSRPEWIAERLDLKLAEVSETLECLERLEMVAWKNGKLYRAVSKYRTTDDVTSASLQRSHQQTLELAMRSLESDPVHARDFTWVTFPMDLEKMAKAKTAIRKFQDELMQVIGEDAKPTEVCRLAIQLFPLTQVKNQVGKQEKKK